MQHLPTVHVIMPVYNCENFITDAVNSILAQPYSNIRIVIVDDGSSDNSPAICDHLSETYHNVSVLHKQNGGVSAARNDAIDFILNYSNENDYIAFCDADDLWAKNCITDDIFQQDCDMIVFQSCSMNTNATKCSAKHGIVRVSSPQPGGKNSIWSYPYHFAAFLYKVNLFKTYNLRFYVDLKYNEDKILLMQSLYLSSKIYHFDRMLYLYRKNSASAMHMRPHGIEYYAPLIEGWTRSDVSMKKYENESRGELIAGKILSIIYILDTAKEHYWYFKSKKSLYSFITSLNIYKDFLELNPLHVMPQQAEEHTNFLSHPYLFMMKHYSLGVVIQIASFFKNIPFIANKLYEKEFTIPNQYL